MNKGIKTQKTLSKVWYLFLILSLGGWSVALFYKYWTLKKDAIFDPAQYQGTTGSIILPYKEASLLELKDLVKQQAIRLSSTDGRLQLPTGEFILVSYTISANEIPGMERASLIYLGSPGPKYL